MPEYVTVPQSKLPVVADVDVLVCGGGPAGFAAAVAAARQGAKTLVVEYTGCLGGMATSGLVGSFEHTAGTEGIFSELMDRLGRMGGAQGLGFEAEILKYVALLMAEEAGAEMLLFTLVEDALRSDDRVQGVVIANKSGRGAVRARITVDCSGDGDVCFRAGVPYEKGRADGHIQATSLMFRLGGIDEEELRAALADGTITLKELTTQARQAGELHLPDHLPQVSLGGKGSTIQPGQVSVNLDTVVGVDATSAEEQTQAMNTSRKRIFEVIEFYRKHVPGMEHCYLIDTGALLGVRETRRFEGLSRLGTMDVLQARKVPDGICRASFFLDVHDGQLPRLNPETRKLLRVPEGEWYEIPYGCLVPKGVDGLLVAGRCISSERLANGSLRIMPTCMATGQAAGTAAALCAAQGIEPRQVDIAELRNRLREHLGVQLADEPGCVPVDIERRRAELEALFDVPPTRPAHRGGEAAHSRAGPEGD